MRAHLKWMVSAMVMACGLGLGGGAQAQDAMLGEVRIFGGNFAPRGWAFCDGQLLPIAEYTALFSVLGTTYGGDGETTFALPDLRGRAAVYAGTGAGLPEVKPGEKLGAVATELPTVNVVPSDTVVDAKVAAATKAREEADKSQDALLIKAAEEAEKAAEADKIADNALLIRKTTIDRAPPVLGVRFIIALEGYFPPRE